MESHLDRAVFTESLAQTSRLIVAEVVKELLALCSRLPAPNLTIDLTPGPPPLPETTAESADVLVSPVSIAYQHQQGRVGGGEEGEGS